MNEFEERRREQLELEGLTIPPELAARFEHLDRRQLEGSVWRLGNVLAGVCREHGGSFDVPLEHVLDPRNFGALLDMFPVDGVVRVTLDDG